MAKKIHDSLTELVGHTPLVRLHGYEKKLGLKAHLLAKVEYFNPIGSIKDRIVLRIIEDAEKAGKIQPGKTTLIEYTSGNTGIAVSAIGAMKGYKVRIFLQEGVSKERLQVMKAFGANVTKIGDVPELQDALKATNNDFVAATNILKQHIRDRQAAGDDIYFVDQMINPLNPQAHHDTTGKEIWEDTEGELAAVVASVGTAGTIRGIADYLHGQTKNVKIFAVEPGEKDTKLTGIHNFTEVPVERVPPSIKENNEITKKVFDEVFVADTDGAFEAARTVAKTDGVLVGNSSGAALWGATQIAQKEEFAGKNIVVIFPDTGLRYLSTNLFED
ncbi:PLP-dependent cysteine synthase family protein [uncultured Treponema sp.]|uniref:PLP-dependent cysteine synthase family protein n=1 Tax=uncultured Treponema sp. TaxID=162155 RepID=UPI0025E6650B|nr:PLP-dependent cysteine synthase family protein [uncultured Treponema sp.]